MRGWALVLGSGLLAACVDFVAADGDTPRPAAFQVSIYVGRSDTIQVEARLDPGADAEGRPRAVSDDTLRILGKILLPDILDRTGTRHYATALIVDRSVLSTSGVRVEPPFIAGLDTRHPVVRWFAPGRIDADTIALPQGADLHLRFVPPSDSASPPVTNRQWSVDVFSLGSAFQFFAEGALPANIAVPAGTLPQPGADSLLYATASETLVWTSAPSAGEDYDARVYITFHERWIVRVVPPDQDDAPVTPGAGATSH